MELRPKEIAKLLQKALRRDCLRLIYKVLAPQLFLVHLPEGITSQWRPFIPLLERELADHLDLAAHKLGVETPPGGFIVRITGTGSTGKRPLVTSSFIPLSVKEPQLVSVAGLTPGIGFSLRLPESIIGRGEVDVALPDDYTFVSRRHARLSLSHDGWSIEDLGSRTGVFVNQRPMGICGLKGGDVIGLGNVSLRLCLPAGKHPEEDHEPGAA